MMGTIYDRITEYCVCNGIVDDSNTPWLRYCIEKRVATLLCGIPCFILAVALSDIIIAFSFFVGFFQLRKKAGGFHANTIPGCMFASVSLEVIFLGIISPALNSVSICIISAVNAMVFFLLAPYNHPQMSLSTEEIAALKKHTRITILKLMLVVAFSQVFGFWFIANGLTAGITMAAVMLCTAYIYDWRFSNEKRKNQCQCSFEKSHGENDSP